MELSTLLLADPRVNRSRWRVSARASKARPAYVRYIRCVQELRPRWFLWENVPGALTSEDGGAFGQLLSEMDELGYSLAWRVLDAQFFGVAQRRRRLFLVGHLGAESPAEVLFEPTACQGILNRAVKRGRSLPPELDAALRAQASSTAPRPEQTQ